MKKAAIIILTALLTLQVVIAGEDIGGKLKVRLYPVKIDSKGQAESYLSALYSNEESIDDLENHSLQLTINGKKYRGSLSLRPISNSDTTEYLFLLANGREYTKESRAQQLSAIKGFVGTLGYSDKVSIYSYARELNPLIETLAKEEALEKLNSITVDGTDDRTAVIDSLYRGQQKLSVSEAKIKYLISLGDYINKESRFSFEELQIALSQSKVVLFTTHFDAPGGTKMDLREDLSYETGGHYSSSGSAMETLSSKILTQKGHMDGLYKIDFKAPQSWYRERQELVEITIKHKNSEGSYETLIITPAYNPFEDIFFLISLFMVMLVMLFLLLYLLVRVRDSNKEEKVKLDRYR